MYFLNQNLNSIVSEEQFVPKIRSSITGVGNVSGTLTYQFAMNAMFGVSNGISNVTMATHMLIGTGGGNGANGTATVLGMLSGLITSPISGESNGMATIQGDLVSV
jgi:hypothetical protein